MQNNSIKSNHFKIYKILPKPKWTNYLLQNVLEGEEDVQKIIKDYYQQLYQDMEKQRFSPECKKMFGLLQKISKYREGKKDGSIFREFVANGKTHSEKKEVMKAILDFVKGLQFDPNLTQALENNPQKLDTLTTEKTTELIRSLKVNKAIANDLIIDDIFKEENIDLTSEVLKDIWTIDPGHDLLHASLELRIIPLNKKHPCQPGPTDIRPITIMSPLLKTIESRFLPKLRDYGSHQLFKGQVGFVKGLDTNINIWRVFNFMHNAIKTKNLYFLFIDFSAAYNTINREKLWEYLQKALTKEEVGYIQRLYQFTRIRVDKEEFTPNIGVNQGSVISPMLFNILIEPMYCEIQDKLNAPLECLLGFADDFLSLNESFKCVVKMIQIIKKFSSEHGLKLNPSKSGVMYVCGRRKNTLNLEQIEGIPLVKEYKYLGIVLTQNWSIDKMIEHFSSSSQRLYHKMSIILHKTSTYFRVNMWKLFIYPLLRMILIPYFYESRITLKRKLQLEVKKSLKAFLGLNPKARDSLLNQIIHLNIDELSENMKNIAEWKWNSHIANNNLPNKPSTYQIEDQSKFLPAEIITIINAETSWCQLCKARFTGQHLVKKHSKNCLSVEKIIEMAIGTAKSYQGKSINGSKVVHSQIKAEIEKFLTALNESKM